MLEARWAPLRDWPGPPTKNRKSAQFKMTYQKTLDLLEFEISKLSARDITVYADLPISEIRNDGWPRSNAVPRSPGIVVTFEVPPNWATVSFPCDTYTHWHHNLHAIALSLEALRAVDRHGVTRRGEQYRGFLALPAPQHSADLSRTSAVIALQSLSGMDINPTDPTSIERAFVQAAKLHHPDRGGNRDQYQLALEARKVLKS